MAVIKRLFEAAVDVTARLDEEVDKGVSTAWGDLMKYLHALQIQARCS